MFDIDLSGGWTLTSPQHPGISVPMPLPGDNHSALVKAGVLEDPYYACNESRVQWVGECEWYLSRVFELSAEQLEYDTIVMELGRVDTLATLFINNQPIFECDNMFRHYQVDLKPWLTEGENHIQFRFAPVAPEAQRRADRLPFPVPWAKGNNQIPHMNTIRKAQCHAGWDWGICLAVCGIYESTGLILTSKPRIERLTTEQHWKDDGSVEVEVIIHHPQTAGETIEVSFDQRKQSGVTSASGITRMWFKEESPKLWWPAGYGDQPLYELTATLGESSVSKKLGLRELRLDTTADDTGSAMTFVVNGFPVTAKGANWIPMDAMPGLESPARYRRLLEDAKAANMNMIRVWGGGQYEADVFYQLCDELGLMVWQDMMFACSLYPSTPEFIAGVEPEIRDQIRRLRDHPSIALWCGDNEVIGAIGWYPESRNAKEKYTVNYDRLNRRLGEIIAEEDPSRRFWASSPCNGELDFGDAWHDDNKGDMHFWDVWHSGAAFSAYEKVRPRFCSEFGFQSWPSLAEVKRFVPQEEWNITSPTFETHQKNARGNSIITEMFTRYFRFPSGFEQMLYLSQVQQAIAIKTGCDHWRASSPVCRGMLYWQLNDNWPVASWSGIEYSGRWKQLHYHARRFFAPVYAPFSETEQEIVLQLLNEQREAVTVQGRLLWLDWQGNLIHQWELDGEIQADGNKQWWSMDKSVWAERATEGFLYVQLSSPAGVIENTWFETPELKKLPMAKASVQHTVSGRTITLTTDTPAFFVHLECDAAGRFSDSSFTLLPGEQKQIEYLGDDPAALESLRVYHLMGN